MVARCLVRIALAILLSTSCALATKAQERAANVFTLAAHDGGTDVCADFRATAASLERAGGGILRLSGRYVSSCKWAISNVPVTIEGSGVAACAILFTRPNDAGLVIREDDGHKRVVIRGCQIYSMVPQDAKVPAIDVAFPFTNTPDDAVTIDNVQISASDDGFFGIGISCFNCTHQQFHQLDIQGKGEIQGHERRQTMETCIVLGGFSASGKLSDFDCIHSRFGLIESGKTEGSKISNVNMVAVTDGIVLDDGTLTRDPQASPFTPGPQIENWHCDAYEHCLVSKGWSQIELHNFNFFKRSESQAAWAGIELLDGLYSGRTFPTTFAKIAFGRCLQYHTSGGAICVRLGPKAFSNTVSNVEPNGMDYFIDEGKYSKWNVITDNIGFPPGDAAFSGQYSILHEWRQNGSRLNYSRRNIPPGLAGSGNIISDNSSNPSIGGFNTLIFHLANTKKTVIENFENGLQGDVLDIVADNELTTIANGPRISTKSKRDIHPSAGTLITFVFDRNVWRQR